MNTSSLSLAHLRIAAIAALLPLAFAGRAYAADVYVSGNGSDAGDGTVAAPYRTISKAVAEAGADGVVHIDEGTYDAVAGESFPIAVASDVAVVGWSQSGAAIDPSLRIVTGDNAVANLFAIDAGLSF